MGAFSFGKEDNMTVQNVIVKNIYAGNGSNTNWPYTFACPENHPEFIKAYIKDPEGNVHQTEDFKVDTSTKTVTYPVTGKVLSAEEKIVIARELPLYQVLNLVNQGPFFAEDVEVTFDELVMMIQQLNEQLGRSLKVGIDIDQEKEIDITIPVPTDDGNYGLRITKNGFELVNDPSSVYDETVAMKKLAEAANAEAQNAANVAQALVGEDYQKAYNNLLAIDDKLTQASEKVNECIVSADNANNSALSASQYAASALNSANNANSATNSLISFLETKESLTAPAIDKGLSVSNAAADSKIVGDEIAVRDKAIRTLLTPYYEKVDLPVWTIGGWNNSGTKTTLKTRLRLNEKIAVGKGSYVVCNAGYKMAVALYDYNGVRYDSSGWVNGLTTYCIPDDCLITVQMGRIDDSTFTDTSENVNVMPYLYLIKQQSEKTLLAGKNVAIIGSSTSTHGKAGTNPNAVEIEITESDVGVQLSAYLTYYDVQANLSLGGHTFTTEEIGNEVTFTPTSADVGKAIGVSNNKNANDLDVWWTYIRDELGANIIPVAWSGASITSHEQTTALKTSYAWHDAQIRKCGIRIPGSMQRNAPDVIIIKRGTNDTTHTPYVEFTDGYFDSVNFNYPTTDLRADGKYGFKEGLVLTIKKLRDAYPYAKIMLATVRAVNRVKYDKFPANNGKYAYQKMNEAIREVAAYMQCDVLELANCGITWENTFTYASDGTHPNADGHRIIGQKAVAEMKAKYSPM